MNINPPPGDADKLVALASQAKHYAAHMMRTTGSVPPTVIADTSEGLIFCMPSNLANEAAKDRFAEMAKSLAVAYDAQAIVMVVEAWARMASADGKLDTVTPPSQSPDRMEVVALILEDASRTGNDMLPIIRDERGNFVGFGDSQVPKFTSATGRFAGLMPKHRPDASEMAKAKALLHAAGMTVVNRGIDPSMN